MSNRSYEDAADEYNGLSFYQSVSRFADAFAGLSRGELMAMGGKFLELAHGIPPVSDDERQTSACLAEAIEEVILFKLAGNDEGIRAYLAAKEVHLEHLCNLVSSKEAAEEASSTASSSLRQSSSWVSGWFGKKK